MRRHYLASLIAPTLSLATPSLLHAQANATNPEMGASDTGATAAPVFVKPDVHGNEVWGAGYWPNVVLTGHDGKQYRFFDDLIKDKIVAINFIYTHCPDACPLETAKLAEVSEVLGDQMGKDVFFLSITIDPDRDTPKVLSDYSKRFRAGKGWMFLTGKEADIKLLRLKCGLMSLDNQTREDHSLDFLCGNQATGRWMKQSAFENPYMLAVTIGDWLDNYKKPRGERGNYDSAPTLHNLSKGESLFRTRCLACHVIGKGDGLTRQGPNLVDVTSRREPAWLQRWLREPDVMLAEKDPIATQMFEAFNKVSMPNLKLADDEIQHLLDYIKTQSRIAAMEEQAPDVATALRVTKVDSCCAKKAEAAAAAAPATDAVAEAKPADEGHNRGLSATSLVSVGLGLIGLLTAFVRRQR